MKEGFRDSPIGSGARKTSQHHSLERIALRVGHHLAITARTLLRRVEARSPRQWLIKDLLRTGALAEIVEAAKSGKTSLIVQLLAAFMRGDEFLGRVTQRVRIGYFGVEHDIRDLVPILQANGVQDILTISDAEPYLLPHRKAYMNFLRYVRRAKLGFIALDPITDFIDPSAEEFGLEGFDENKSAHWKPVMDCLLRIAKKTGCAILFSRHKAKAREGKRGSRIVSAGRGSNYPESKVTLLLNLTRFGNQGWMLDINGKGIPRQNLWLVSGDGRYTFTVDDKSSKQDVNARTYSEYVNGLRKAVRMIVGSHGGTVSGKEFFFQLKELKESNTGLDVPLRGRAFKTLLRQAGIIQRHTHGRSRYVLSEGGDKGEDRGGNKYIGNGIPTPKSTPLRPVVHPKQTVSSPRTAVH